MLLFGHTGITLAAAMLANSAVSEYRFRRSLKTAPASGSEHPKDESSGRQSHFLSLSEFVDVRLLLIGSLLPDIIDKPVGRLFFPEAIGAGRMVSHTLVFFLLLFLVGWYLYRSHCKSWLLVLSAGTFSHLLLDSMWQTPQTLFWPLYGWAFPRELGAFWTEILSGLLTEPGVWISELVGLAVLGMLAWALVRRRVVWHFVKSGRI